MIPAPPGSLLAASGKDEDRDSSAGGDERPDHCN